jgi:hypothetical protein
MRTILNGPCTTLFFDPPQGFKTLAPMQEESLVLQDTEAWVSIKRIWCGTQKLQKSIWDWSTKLVVRNIQGMQKT